MADIGLYRPQAATGCFPPVIVRRTQVFKRRLEPVDLDGVTQFGAGYAAGDVRYFQTWYRDPTGGPCGAGFNLTNGMSAAFAP